MAEFGGVIGDSWRESTPWWPPDPVPPEGAPNVLLVVLDDVGYAQLGCYGSDIGTPVLDALAADGVRLTRFHTTALCSPTRACLLTGRNHHSNGMARVADLAVGFPGYNGIIPRRPASSARSLPATATARSLWPRGTSRRRTRSTSPRRVTPGRADAVSDTGTAS